MARRTGRTPLERFLAAAAAGADDQAEALVGQLSHRDVPGLVRWARTRSPDLRWWALRGLAQVGDGRAVPVLVAALEDPCSELRVVAARALARVYSRAPDAVRPHLARLADLLADPDGMARQAASDALAQIGPEAVDVLAQALASPEPARRARAAAALHRMGHRAAAGPLYGVLEDEHPLVRHHAHEALDELGLLNNLLLRR